jgi:hypothetical protein
MSNLGTSVELSLILLYFSFYFLLTLFFILIYVYLLLLKFRVDFLNIVYGVRSSQATFLGAVSRRLLGLVV